jgi:hypothetical protein
MFIQNFYRSLIAMPQESFNSYEEKSLINVDVIGIAQKWKQSLENAKKSDIIACAGSICGLVINVFSDNAYALIYGKVIAVSSAGLAILSYSYQNLAAKEEIEWRFLEKVKKMQLEKQTILDFANSIDLKCPHLRTFEEDFFERGDKIFPKKCSYMNYSPIFHLLKQEYAAYIKEVGSYRDYIAISASAINDAIFEEKEKFLEIIEKLHIKYNEGNLNDQLFVLIKLESQVGKYYSKELNNLMDSIKHVGSIITANEAIYAVYLYPMIEDLVIAIRTDSEIAMPKVKKFICPITFEFNRTPYEIPFEYNSLEFFDTPTRIYFEVLGEINKLLLALRKEKSENIPHK